MKTHFSSIERIEANRAQLLEWEREGRSYFWMAQQIGIACSNHSVISKWFIRQGIRRKEAR